jgi:hypothetical protein
MGNLRCKLNRSSQAISNILVKFRARSAPARPLKCFTLGHRKLLAQPLLAFFCSESCPGDLIIQACDVATALRDGRVPVISGFHSPVEN